METPLPSIYHHAPLFSVFFTRIILSSILFLFIVILRFSLGIYLFKRTSGPKIIGTGADIVALILTFYILITIGYMNVGSSGNVCKSIYFAYCPASFYMTAILIGCCLLVVTISLERTVFLDKGWQPMFLSDRWKVAIYQAVLHLPAMLYSAIYMWSFAAERI